MKEKFYLIVVLSLSFLTFTLFLQKTYQNYSKNKCTLDPNGTKVLESVVKSCDNLFYDSNGWKAIDLNYVGFESKKDVPIINTCEDTCKKIHPFLKQSFLKLECKSSYMNYIKYSEKTIVLLDYNDYWDMWWVLVATTNYFSMYNILNVQNPIIVHVNHDPRINVFKLPLMDIVSKVFPGTVQKLWDPKHMFSKNTIYKRVIILPHFTYPSILVKNKKNACISPTLMEMNKLLVSRTAKDEQVCWVSRKKTHKTTYWQNRRVVPNEYEFLKKLSALISKNVTILELEKLTLEEQIDIIGHCGLVVGMHGAGMNAAFFMKHPRLLVLNTPQYNEINLMYALDGHYHSIDNWKIGDYNTLAKKIVSINYDEYSYYKNMIYGKIY